MMKTIYSTRAIRSFIQKVTLILCGLVLLGINESFASHMAGSDLTYQYVGNGRYVVTYTLYRDCFGIPAPGSVNLQLSSYSCNNFSTNFFLPAIPNTGQEITHNCTGAPTTCNGGSATGIQEYIYRDTITIPAQCADWLFSVYDCCRNQAITTISNASGEGLYVESYLNNAVWDHSSPSFTNPPVVFFCIGQTNIYNGGLVDPSGDSLVYSMVPPLNGANDPLAYNAGYSIAMPVTSSPAITINPVTGDLMVTPTQVEIGVIAVQIMEYRNGVLIGTVMRDIQVYTVQCSNILPTATGINGTSTFSASSCGGGPLCFDIISSDSDPNDTLTMSWNQAIPGATFSIVGNYRPVGTFCWSPTPADARPQPYTFTVTVRDNACPSNGMQTYSYSILVSNLTVSVVATPSVPCHGDHTGTATASATGTAPYTYAWSSLTATTPTVSGLGAGTYTVTITDHTGCLGTQTFGITQPTALTATASAVAGGCNGNSGVITINPAGGTSPYVNNPTTVSGLGTGTYTYTVTDAHQCSTTVSATVTTGVPVSVAIASVNTSCFGGSNGSATATATGGSGPLTYSWSTVPVQTTITATNLTAGTYTVTSSDGNCIGTATVTITQPAALTATMTTSPAHCSDSSGSATIHPAGGTGLYTYSWAPPATGTGATANLLYAGAYSAVVTDANGCSASASGFVNSLGLTLNVTVTDATCSSSEDGSATVVVTGGMPRYFYLWSPMNDTMQSVFNLAPGTYNLTVRDYLGCTIQTLVNVGFVHQAPGVNLGVDTTMCIGNDLVLDAGGGYTYLWSDNSTSQVLQVSTSGTYSVLVTDAFGCQGSDAITVTYITCLQALTSHTSTGALSVYPNPTNSAIHVFISRIRDTDVKITLIDILGNRLLTSNEVSDYGYNKLIDLHQYPAGIYLLKVEYAGEINTIRVVKQ